MVLVTDENTPCVLSFVWTIQNFLYWMGKEEEFMESPDCSMKGATWRLRFYPKGCYVPGFFSFYLELVSKDTPSPIEINCALGIRTRDGTFEKFNDKQFKFKSIGVEGFSKFLVRRQVINQQKKYLQNNNLVLRCRVWKCNYDIRETLHCYARTKIQVTNITKTWKLDKFLDKKSNRTVVVEPNGTDVPSLAIELNARGSRIEEVLNLTISQTDTSMPHLLKMKTSLLDADHRLSCAVEDEYWFTKSKDEQKKSLQFISKRKLLARKDFYLPNDVLTLHLDFIFSFGAKTSKVEKVDHGPIRIQREDGPADVKDSDTVVDSWVGNWSQLLLEGKFSDVIIRTSDRDHHQHKTILAAHSGTFCQMFQQDQNAVVEINHLDDKTVTRMLKFIYTCSTGTLDWDIAPKLFDAAVEFRISALQNMCYIFFRENLTIQTVCELLLLAADKKDAKLKSGAQDFILEHSDEVFSSDDWTKLIKERSDVTSETMHLSFSKK